MDPRVEPKGAKRRPECPTYPKFAKICPKIEPKMTPRAAKIGPKAVIGAVRASERDAKKIGTIKQETK